MFAEGTSISVYHNDKIMLGKMKLVFTNTVN